MNSVVNPEIRICPVCGTTNEIDSLAKREYRCIQCNLELAHLDVAANGVTRGVFGWLHDVGSIIEDRYRVLSVLGKGGFGATYLVEDLRLNGKRRAIKEVPELLFDEYETALLSRLNHPSIPDIIDRNVANGMAYLVLEFGGSKTLGSERKLYQGRIPLDKLMPWMRQLCEVLIYLHSQNPPIIHRDLKPDNILLDENGRIMLIDFGIAKESTPATMTRTIGRAATHGFSPPEQAMGTGTDERSDIYALAATCYALLTGENPPAAHERVAGKELVPPSRLVPDLPPLLESTLLRALNLNVNLRQQTVKEFSLALEAIETEPSGAATHGARYTERTVMLSKGTSAAGLQPHSLKLPSEPISKSNSVQLSQKASPLPASKKNVVFLILGLVLFLAATITGGYFFWPKPKAEKEDTASSQPDIGAASTVMVPSQPASGRNDPLNPEPPPANTTSSISSAPAPTAVAPSLSTKTDQSKQNQNAGSAATAFDEELRKKFGSVEAQPDEEAPTSAGTASSKPKMITAQKRRDDPPKQRVIKRKGEITNSSQNTESGKKTTSSSDDWLNEFSGSANRRK